jgi:hypothetical protein
MIKLRPVLFCAFVVLILLCGQRSYAQVVTGTPPFGSFGGGPDVINLGNLNAHITVPVMNKAGRGTPFTYNLSYDTSVWSPVSSSGSNAWTPVYNWGWAGQTAVSTGYTSSTSASSICYYTVNRIKYVGGVHTWVTNFVYHDPWGVPHPFSGTENIWTGTGDGGCTLGTDNGFTSTTTDGSGYTLNVPNPSSGGGITITTRNGTVVTPPVGSGTGAASFTDRNGNEITVNSSGAFTDTLGTTALTVSVTCPKCLRTRSYDVRLGAFLSCS